MRAANLIAMATAHLPIMRAVGMAYRDALGVTRVMPGLVLIAMAVLLAVNITDTLTTSYVQGRAIAALLREVGIRVAESFLLTPFLIAVHRFIILGEVTPRYALEPRSPRFERYFVWSLLLWIIAISAVLLVRPLTEGVSMAVAAAMVLAALAIVTFVNLRLTLLLPAIAVDAPGATAANAFAATKGHVVAMLFIFVLAVLPPISVVTTLALGLLLWSPKSMDDGGLSPGSLALAVLLPLVQVTVYALLAAAASRIFQALADGALRRSPD
jgi:hypothetical protein